MQLNRRSFLALLGITPTVSAIMPFSAWLKPEKYDLSMITCTQCTGQFQQSYMIRLLKDCAPIIIDRYGRKPNFKILRCFHDTLMENSLTYLSRKLEYNEGHILTDKYDLETLRIIEEKVPLIKDKSCI